ncbi:MAG TPA: M28 family peptidase, partial [Pirellulales bacterium]|nr:M28 family peptidase [Pirellulales bacterium]
MSKKTYQAAVVAALLLAGLAAAVIIPNRTHLAAAEPKERVSTFRLEDIPFDGRAAYEYLKQICALGPRTSGSAGMVAQQKLLSAHFQRLGAQVSFQEFRSPHPLDGSDVPMANMIVEWHPDRAERILLCTHYDTRPYPDHDRRRPDGVYLGANDGASGLAVLMELGKWMPRLESKYGVDFVLFDGSQFVFKEGTWRKPGDKPLLGASYFSKDYVSNPPSHKYRWGVLLNM